MRRWLVAALLLLAPLAHALEPDASRARAAFVHGVELAKRAEWADALASFELSMAERPHPVTRYNLALCHRALGEPVRAAYELSLALQPGPESLPEDTREEATRLLAQLAPERAFVNVARGSHDSVLVDGRPLEALGADFTPARTPAQSARLPVGSVRIALNPGGHEVRVLREGYTSASFRETLAPGDVRSFAPLWQPLPSVLVVTSAPPGALAQIDGHAASPLPLTLRLSAGAHRVDVRLKGYHPFFANVVLKPDTRSNVHAALAKEHVSVFKRWWFWTAVVGAVAGAGVLTYAVTRPEAPPDGGSLGWVVR